MPAAELGMRRAEESVAFWEQVLSAPGLELAVGEGRADGMWRATDPAISDCTLRDQLPGR